MDLHFTKNIFTDLIMHTKASSVKFMSVIIISDKLLAAANISLSFFRAIINGLTGGDLGMTAHVKKWPITFNLLFEPILYSESCHPNLNY